MEKEIIRKKYARITFTIDSPLAIGSGENRYTDSDIIKDRNGKPYIPASAIAGVTREILSGSVIDENEINTYFGNVNKNTHKTDKNAKYNKQDEKANNVESSVIFYDATLKNDSPCHISIRDNVALDEYKTAKKGAKFDMEVLEAGAKFETYLEQSFYEGVDVDYIDKIVDVLHSGKVRFGGKTMRGYGNTCDVCINEKEFIFKSKKENGKEQDLENVEKWLEFDIYNYPWKEEESKTVDDSKIERKKELVINLRQNGGISIRKYATRVQKDENDIVPDYEQLTAFITEHDTEAVMPVIPGTSWAGAFRHRMKDFGINVDESGSIFGYVKGKMREKSKISFSESRISGAMAKTLSHNAIDRFTSGTVEGALFKEQTYYYGTTKLIIGWNGGTMDNETKSALAATIADIHYGFLAVGGETSIGRGLFTVDEINGKKINDSGGVGDSEIYKIALQSIEEVFSNDSK